MRLISNIYEHTVYIFTGIWSNLPRYIVSGYSKLLHHINLHLHWPNDNGIFNSVLRIFWIGYTWKIAQIREYFSNLHFSAFRRSNIFIQLKQFYHRNRLQLRILWQHIVRFWFIFRRGWREFLHLLQLFQRFIVARQTGNYRITRQGLVFGVCGF